MDGIVEDALHEAFSRVADLALARGELPRKVLTVASIRAALKRWRKRGSETHETELEQEWTNEGIHGADEGDVFDLVDLEEQRDVLSESGTFADHSPIDHPEIDAAAG
jgi:hypothetical protein